MSVPLQIDKNELYRSGFIPQRHGLIVKLIRRIVWPFIRPFFFHQSEKMTEMLAIMDSMVLQNSRLEQNINALTQQNLHLEQRSADFIDIVKGHVLMRSDIAALKNRFIVLDLLDDSVSVLRSTINSLPTRNEFQLLKSDLESLKNRYFSLVSSDDLAAATHDIQIQVIELENSVSRFNEHLKSFSNKEIFPSLLVTHTENGIFLAKPGEIISDFILRGGEWDAHIAALIKKVAIVRKGNAVDVGAHFGSVSLAMANNFESVFSFEPNDFNFLVLRANIAINNLSNVKLFNSGLFSHSTNLSLGKEENQEIPLPMNAEGEFDGFAANNLGAYLFSEDGSGIFTHQARTLDSYGLQDISFIKIDVQGADGEVIMGALDTIRRCQPVVVFEWEDGLSANFNVSFQNIQNEFDKLNYHISPLKTHNEKQIDFVAHPSRFN